MLSARDLACVRGTTRLFGGLSFAVSRGDLWQITGANGCGKTTLLRALAGLTLPDQGEIRWAGEPIRGNEAYRSSLAYAPYLAPWKDMLPVADNLAIALRVAGAAATPQEQLAAIDHVGLKSRRRLEVRRLSQGQKKRLALAWLRLARRTLWLLDEPLTALDDAGQALLVELLCEHLAGGGAAIVATHADLPGWQQPCRRMHFAVDGVELA